MMWLLNELQDLISALIPIVRYYGLWALSGSLFLDSAGVVVMPGESILVVFGFFAGRGVFPFWAVLIIGVVSAFMGGEAAYGVGRRFGDQALLRYGRFVRITPAKVKRAHAWLSRWGAPVFVLGRFVVPVRQLEGYVAGSANVGFLPYSLWGSLGAMLWVLAWAGGGWLLAGEIGIP